MASSDRSQQGSGNVVEVAIAIIRRGSELLICQRKADAVLGGYWEFPGGKIDPHELPPAAAEREALEELDVIVRATETLAPITHAYDHAIIRLTPILCDYLSGDPKPLGCATFRWVPVSALSDYPFPPANAPLLKELLTRFK